MSTIEYPANSPLELVTNDYRINRIIQPSLNLLVVDDLAQSLVTRFSLKTAGVIISDVARIEYVENDMRHWESPGYKDSGGTPEKILERAAKKSNRSWSGPAYFEIIPHDGESIAKNSIETFSKSVKFVEIGDERTLVGSRDALKNYGVLWSDGVHCFRPDIFEVLKPDLHPDYFISSAITV